MSNGSQSLWEKTAGFVAKNKTAILITSLAGASAAGAYVYYQQQAATQGSTTETTSKKKNKKKKKKAATPIAEEAAAPAAERTTAVSTASEKPFPVDAAGLPALTGEIVAALSPEQIEEWSVALKESGNVVFKEKSYEAAIAFYSAALQVKEDPVFYSNRSACYSALEDHENVIADTTAALTLKPDYSKCLLRRAASYELLEQYENAMFDLTALTVYGGFNNQSLESTLERVLKKHSVKIVSQQLENRVPSLPSASSISSFFGAFIQETTLGGLLSQNAAEGSADAYLYHALAELAKNTPEGYEAADVALAQAVAAYGDVSPDAENAVQAAVALEYSGAIKFLKNDPLASLVDINAALAIKPRARTYVFKALIAADKANFEDALASFAQAVETDASCPDIYYHQGQMYYLTGDLAQAEEQFEKAKLYNPDNVYAYIQLACIAYRNGQSADAEAKFAEARAKFPTSPEIPNYYGEILADKGDLAGSLKQFDTAARLQEALPNFSVGAVPLVNKATLISREGKVDEAVEILTKACELDPKSELARISLAQLMLQTDKVEDAITLFEESSVLARALEEKIQATSFAEASKMQIRIKQDPHLSQKLGELMAQASAMQAQQTQF
ncbi:hypothetical protein BABINDRAFT_5613 [Babjeviella inositovora NRRL Y-12698]|uniref:Uncharacterized protein n=1 Tax=Babjeviella inositovora NRRL Y-12698 TaxID=984486 RepID=A0A1E3QYQ3_9ASCO|nr:uncharacterized protein BABINDRAFT_5613 [Babjeviella inositovora NRRL Y-12698]ODQ82684.1 hypothetical protein BABINDRAFT_5613 [Babjeviella inositovora NRRL Y-12698]